MGKLGERVTVNLLEYSHPCIIFEVLTAMKIKISYMGCNAMYFDRYRIYLNNEQEFPVQCLKIGGGGGDALYS
jgi:hypothetical protein